MKLEPKVKEVDTPDKAIVVKVGALLGNTE